MASNDNTPGLAVPDMSIPVVRQEKEKSWLQRFRLRLASQVYREKFYYMIGLYLTYFFSGWVAGLKGPAFTDLRQITGVGTGRGGVFFTAAAVGAGVGNLVGGAIYDRYNRHIVLFASTALYGVTCAIIPCCSIYWTMVWIFLLHELVEGAARSGSNVEIVEEWGDESKPFMQALHFFFSIGATVSPYVLEPFLAEEIPSDNSIFSTTAVPFTTTHSTASNNVTTSPSKRYTESRIHYSFLIVGILAVLSSFVFLIKYHHDKQSGRSNVRRKDNEKKETDNGKGEEEEMEEPHRKKRNIPLRLAIGTILLFGLFYFFLDEVEDTSPAFLSTFVVQQLGWTTKYGGRLSSAFFAAYTAGRGFGIVLVNFLSHIQLFTICCIVLCCGQVGLLLSGMYQFEAGIWICIVTIGLSISIIFPASLTWTEKELMPLSGKLMGIIYVALALGGLANPLVIGITMELYSPMWYSYVLCVESVLFAITFLLLVLYVKKVLSKHRQESRVTAMVTEKQEDAVVDTEMTGY